MRAACHRLFRLEDPEARQAARRELVLLARHLDWPPSAAEELFHELETHLWRSRGRLLYRLLEGGLEIVATSPDTAAPDLGPAFEVHRTELGQTVAITCLGAATPTEVGGLAVSLDGGEAGGDGWAFRRDGDTLSLLVVDGLGHGSSAAEARDRALDLFETRYDGDAERFLETANTHLRQSRGAAVGLAIAAPGRLRFVGVGNVAGWLVSESRVQRLVSLPGTLGLKLARPHFRTFEHPWSAGDLIVLATDGLKPEPPDQSRLWSLSPALIAASLFADLATLRDDAAVAAVRCP